MSRSGKLTGDIRTQYELRGTIVTKSEGGSSVRVDGSEAFPNLEIFVSEDKRKRDCARITDLPRQMIAALKSSRLIFQTFKIFHMYRWNR